MRFFFLATLSKIPNSGPKISDLRTTTNNFFHPNNSTNKYLEYITYVNIFRNEMCPCLPS